MPFLMCFLLRRMFCHLFCTIYESVKFYVTTEACERVQLGEF
jgi:hypothetical protein